MIADLEIRSDGYDGGVQLDWSLTATPPGFVGHGTVTIYHPTPVGTVSLFLAAEEFYEFREAINAAYDHVRQNKETTP